MSCCSSRSSAAAPTRDGKALTAFTSRLGRSVRAQFRPRFGRHELGPGVIHPQLRGLVRERIDARRAGAVVDDVTVSEAHRVVEVVALRNDALRRERALIPVLAVVLLEHPGRPEVPVGRSYGNAPDIGRRLLVDEDRLPYLHPRRTQGVTEHEFARPGIDEQVRENEHVGAVDAAAQLPEPLANRSIVPPCRKRRIHVDRPASVKFAL